MPLTATEFKRKFMASDELLEIRAELERMVADPLYVTKTFYTPADNHLSFVEKHVNYLSEHPKLRSSEYLANLRLMTKARR